MSFIAKIFGDANEKYLKNLQPVVDKINSFEKNFEGFSTDRLKEKTRELKKRHIKGEGPESLLAEAFALVREAAKRTLGQRHFDVQLIGGIVLHQGKIAEMKTGEGKTLAATLPTFLNALAGKGVHIVTVNDYLARRDTVWMGQIYHTLGLSAGCIVHDAAYIYDPAYVKEQEAHYSHTTKNKEQLDGQRDKERDTVGSFKVMESYLRPVSRKEAYSADITYGTNNEFGFDYLRDNMAFDLSQQVQRGFNYAIVDEVDSILIDEARTPLIISAPDIESSKWYKEFSKIIPRLSQTDYEIDEKMRAATLTEQGINKIENILGMKNIYEERGIKYLHHLEQALRAQAINPADGKPLFAKDRDYVVKDGQVIIVDEFTGRLMPGRRWSGGLHQAIEAKEGVEVKPESLTLATITFQNYFRLYKKLAGMTGTAATSAEEFDKVYGLDVAIVPTNRLMIRIYFPDRIYKTQKGKFEAVLNEVKKRNQLGQPILVGTTSIEKNEFLGKLLAREGVPHQILNAKNHEREGEIIAQTGKLGAVTVATNMAGRGVDIILGGNPPNPEEAEKIKGLGGLHVIGTERHEARRIDNQLRGRSGRQGDPGSSQFFSSLEDDLMRIFGGDRIKSVMDTLKIPEDQPIEAKVLSKAIEDAQSKIEGMNFDLRKHILEYDDVMNKHRETIYRRRKEILLFSPLELGEKILEIAQRAGLTKKDYEQKEKELGEDALYQVEKIIYLRTLDMLWTEHLENMEYLRDSVRLRAYGQQDPLVEYKNEGHKMFQNLLKMLEASIIHTIFNASLQPLQKDSFAAETNAQSQPSFKRPRGKVGRNDPCPCGAKHPDGRPKKYKKCHGG